MPSRLAKTKDITTLTITTLTIRTLTITTLTIRTLTIEVAQPLLAEFGAIKLSQGASA